MSGSGQREGYRHRLTKLNARLRSLPDLAVAFSGGVDSSVLLHAASAALGRRAAGLVADSPSLPRRELSEALAFARSIGARLEVLPTDELSSPGYRENAGRRCYHCKRTLFEAMASWARRNGFRALAFGEITDDLRDDRPGALAAAELGVLAPLRSAGFSKQDVRRYAREHGLAVARKPASACLASRVPLGVEVSAERLARVERAEEAVRRLGFAVLRVRDHFPLARLEVGAGELARAHGQRQRLEALLREQGYASLERLSVYGAAAEPVGPQRVGR